MWGMIAVLYNLFTGTAVDPDVERITEDGQIRITEDGQIRVTE